MGERFTAITRGVSAAIGECQLTYRDRASIDVERAKAQHRAYGEVLRELGCDVVELPPRPEFPDSVFVEDAALVFPELAVLTRPGVESREREPDLLRDTLARYRDEIARIEGPSTLDGGDVLTFDRRVWVGWSSRTDPVAIGELRQVLEPFGYEVTIARPKGCLHLKSAATRAGDFILINPDGVDRESFEDVPQIEVDPTEPDAANVLTVGETIVASSAYPRTADRLREAGLDVRLVDASELAKAEGALTCCSIIF